MGADVGHSTHVGVVCPVFGFGFLHQIRRVLDVKCGPVKTHCAVVTPPTSRWSLSFLFSPQDRFSSHPVVQFYSDVFAESGGPT